MRTRAPISRRDRPAKPALSREAIVAAALHVLKRDGAEKLTIRRVADELDTGPASLYVYVKNVTVLHALLIDGLLADLDLAWDGAEPGASVFTG
ncbi:TetR/AcrR family transcriptional regulator [Cellulosimicrobium sp. CUA-896]|uniref:TetR/AcrR family transcriptional regulator n=1 Tax=Cellulosimicrobium sp. CUA-896 TaxID=1517881 RepID=UPI000A91FAB6|nr:TetR family transcriptional regulator [Cellulosimicrobium sp. CUA-896]